jgi:hypothetical protein
METILVEAVDTGHLSQDFHPWPSDGHNHYFALPGNIIHVMAIPSRN